MSRVVRSRLLAGVFLLALALVLAACGGGGGGGQEEKGGDTEASGGGGSSQIAIEGSSTVLPVTQAAAEAFNQENPDVDITVGGAGTGDGFEAFCSGDTQISDASRPIEEDEIQACQENGVEFIELPVATDALSVVVNPQTPIDNITLEQLNTLWCPPAEGQIDNLNQVDPSFPDQPVNLYGPGTQSGTFDYFTDEVCGEEGASRTDYQASEDDSVLVQGVSGDPSALGYFGLSYYLRNQEILKALTVEGIPPSLETAQSGEYPLSRPLFIYVSTQALEENPSVEEFVSFYLENLDQFAEQAEYASPSPAAQEEARERLQNRTTGTDPEGALGGEEKGKDEEKEKTK
ncbi:MAG: Phosphate ABC transporter, periplasmic phosphate-binding protein PstS [uncultured Rubrobacteraceae bacterium]|uniref:Phosphate-binding protein n=1 Tax=uncultured Rubrobacteraceae bacterium TaxID=349277 RepID=A0A6J4QMZ6_9ACTN|nr:MAG: Phosphate ABC transporter, periplasmic phosphate-binding protein PstS [uncultured Rubrobacteraceae bacterium]